MMSCSYYASKKEVHMVNFIKPKKLFINHNNGNAKFDDILMHKVSLMDEETLFSFFSSNPLGLSNEEAEKRIEKYGLNEVSHEEVMTWYKQLFKAFLNPFVYILSFIGIISFILDVLLANVGEEDYKTVIIVSAMILISGLLRFIQEFRNNKAVQKLKSMVKTTATVIRKYDNKKEIEFKQLVPGDIILLSAGNMLPADCRIIKCKDLFVSESMLTGESMPIEKKDLAMTYTGELQVTELNNICFMGTNILTGTAEAIVIATGNNTYFGNISKSIVGNNPQTAFDKGINQVSVLLIKFMLFMVPIVFIVNGIVKHDWMDSLLFAVAVAVGSTPEMLPMIVSANLAKGAVNMSKFKVIVKRLNSIQNIGAIDVLCTDKTGTLTLDKVVLEKYLNVLGEDDVEVLKWAYLNSFHQTGLRNLLDIAVLNHTEVHNFLKVEEQYENTF